MSKKSEKELTRKDPEMAISIAESFGEIYETVKDLGSVKGEEKTYSSAQLIKIIERVRNLHRPLEFVTRAHGIRDAVDRLLEDDKTYQKALRRDKNKQKKLNKKRSKAA